jgi:hypothetical protein
VCCVCYTCSEREYFSHTIILLFVVLVVVVVVVVVDCRGTILHLSYLLALFSFAASVFCVVLCQLLAMRMRFGSELVIRSVTVS